MNVKINLEKCGNVIQTRDRNSFRRTQDLDALYAVQCWTTVPQPGTSPHHQRHPRSTRSSAPGVPARSTVACLIRFGGDERNDPRPTRGPARTPITNRMQGRIFSINYGHLVTCTTTHNCREYSQLLRIVRVHYTRSVPRRNKRLVFGQPQWPTQLSKGMRPRQTRACAAKLFCRHLVVRRRVVCEQRKY